MKEVTCSCGYVASAETAEELLTEVEIHIAASHGAESGRTGEARRADPEGHTEAAGSAGNDRLCGGATDYTPAQDDTKTGVEVF